MATDERSTGLRRFIQRLTATEAELDAQELQRESANCGAVPAGQCRRGQVVSVSGRLRTVAYTPRTNLPTLEADLYDGSDVVTLVWLGRRQILGIEPGRQLTVRGRIALREDRKVIYNPYYELGGAPVTAGRDEDHVGIGDRLAGEVVEELELQPAPDADDEPMPTMSEQIAEQLGGARGLIESSIPVLTFVLLNFVLSNDRLGLVDDERSGLYWAIAGAVATAVLIAGYRLFRREPVRHAVNGLIGIALGASLAARSGQAKDFYLPGILLTLGQALALLVSVGLRKPIIGYVWAVMANGGKHDWLTRPGMLRMFQWLTVAWAVSLIVRGGVQGLLYLAGKDDLLGVARIFLSWPIYAGMLALTVWAVRRHRRTEPA